GGNLKIEITSRRPFYEYSVGIWLLPKALWHECAGYNEDMIYMNEMETNMISRLMQKYRIVDLGRIVGYDFYHLEHYHPRIPRKSGIYRKVNTLKECRTLFNPNTEEWGLAHYRLSIDSCPSSSEVAVVSNSVKQR